MAFIEDPRFPDKIGYQTVGGGGFRTRVTATAGDREYRNQRPGTTLRRFDVAHAAKTGAEIDELDNFFHAVARGRLHMFRFKAPRDWFVTVANGALGAGVGAGVPTYQINRVYAAGAYTHLRALQKPVANTLAAYRDASPIAFGASSGEIAVDNTTGLVTFVADDSEAITGHTPGANHVFTTAADVGGLAIGQLIYIDGVVGSAAAALNALAHTIANKTGTGPYTWTLATDTTGLAVSTDGSAYAYPQAAEALTCACEYDTPVRFDVDEFLPVIVGRNRFALPSLPLVERRLP